MQLQVSGSGPVPRSGRLAGGFALLAALIAGGLLIAWASGLRTVSLTAALALLLASYSLALTGPRVPVGARRRTQATSGAILLLLGAALLCTWLLQVLAEVVVLAPALQDDVLGIVPPGRLGLAAASGFVAMGLGLVLLDRPRLGAAAEAAALLAVGAGVVLLLDRAYAVSEAYGLVRPYALVPSACGFVLIGLGLLAARPQRGLAALLASPGAGGVMSRRLLPLAVLAPVVIGWARIVGEQRGLYPSEAAVAAVVVCYMALSAAFVLRTALALRQSAERESAAERARRKQQVHFDEIIASTMDAVIMVDATQRVRLFNPAAERMFGRSAQALYGEPLTILLPEYARAAHDQGFRSLVAAEARPEGIRQLAGRRADGEEFPVEASIARHQVDGELYFTAILRDVTQTRRTEAALRAAKAEAERADDAKSRFLAAASHDLRQPLSALALYATVLKGHVDPAGGPLLDNLNACVASLSALLTDLLDLSKLQAGVVRPNVNDFPVAEVLASVVSAHEPEARLKGLRLRCRASALSARTDPVLLRRIVGNFLDNAIRYTERGGVLVGCRRRGGKLRIEVWDTGVGIPPQSTGEIFEEFRQLGDDARTRGSGLGLAIVARTAELLGLEVSVRSRVGSGSVFAIEVPLGRSAELQPVPPAAPTHHGLWVALVEDNGMVRDALAAALRAVGYRVVAAESGAALGAALAGRLPDVVVSDYRLAQAETGFDVITAVRAAAGRELPAILVTGDTDPKLVRNMAARGIVVLHKPVDIESLQAYIEDLCSEEPAPAQ